MPELKSPRIEVHFSQKDMAEIMGRVLNEELAKLGVEVSESQAISFAVVDCDWGSYGDDSPQIGFNWGSGVGEVDANLDLDPKSNKPCVIVHVNEKPKAKSTTTGRTRRGR